MPGRTTLPRFVLAVAAVVMIAGVWTVAGRMSEHGRKDALLGRLREARAAIDSCRAALDVERDAFAMFDRRVDSLRGAAAAYERQPGKVAASEYPAYLGAVQDYNEAIPEWRRRADALQSHWAGCSDLTRGHNAIADSLREIARERSAVGDR